MSSNSYEDWISIYNNNIKTTWEAERLELRKISMIYCAFQTELNKLKTSISDEILAVKSELRKRDSFLKRKTFKGLAQSEQFTELIQLGKENQTPTSPLKQLDFNDAKTGDFLPKSPILSTKCSPTSPFIFPQVPETPKCDDSNILECSIIENTPVVKPKKRTKPSFMTQKRQKLKNKTKQETTLTQMFLQPRKEKEIDSNMPSMTLNEMINLINDSSGSETEAELEPLEVTTEPKKSPIRESPEVAFEEVVRGKARKKLKGWSCHECRDYYEVLNLPPDELEKRKNECSRHRRKFQRNETYEGFWDLTFGPTPKTQNSQSMVFNKK
ncbi:DNA endonuclease RBBP8-like [Tribolium madens]|uniref:DNA endonuclease RBBP8-like n=1 Tax=Tribolium madens TaxID=41895 RepID=UPI001CF724D4|nr:DNA endonuclease RBBP8-like [Tribolium madens]